MIAVGPEVAATSPPAGGSSSRRSVPLDEEGADVLGRSGLLDELTPDQRDLAMRLFRPARYAFGDELCRAGGPNEHVLVLVRGRVRILVVEDGHEEPVGWLVPGAVVGGPAVLAGSPNDVTCRASGPVEVLRLGLDGAAALAGLSPAFGRLVGDAPSTAPRQPRRPPRPVGAATARPPAVDPVPHDASDLDRPARERARGGHRRFPFVPQVDEDDSAAACLAMVARHHGRAASLAFIRDATAGRQGTSLAGIEHAGAAIGLDVTPFRVSPDRREDLALPAIIHWEDRHWVVLVALGDRPVVADPATGVHRIDRDELDRCWSGHAASVRPTAALHDAPVDQVSIRWILPFLRAHRGVLALSLVLALLGAGFEVGLPMIVQQLVDRVSDGSADLHGLGVALAGLVVAAVGCRLVQHHVLVRTAARLDASMIDFVTARLLGLPLSYFAARRTGDLERRVVGMSEVRRVVVQQGTEAVTAAVLLLASVAVMATYSWPLALAFCVVLPVYGVVMRWSTTRLRPIFACMEEAFGQHLSRQVDLLKGIETVKSLGAEPGLRRWMRDAFTQLRRRIEPGYQAMARYDVVVWAIGLTTYAAVVYLGGIATATGRLTLGEYVAVMALVLLCIPPLTTLMQAWDDVQLSSVLLGRVHDVIAREPEVSTAEELPRPTRVEGRLEARGVGLHVAGSAEPIVTEVDLDIEPGMTVALVGRSGSGKTTLLRLLAGMIEPTEGRIRWDGTDLRDVDRPAWRAGIGVALQSAYLFERSLEDNIRFGRPDQGPDAMAQAVRVAGLDDLVAGMPLGLRTPVGDGGLLLSGGEAQRVALARALYGDPDVLFLDEATSALDAETETFVTDQLRGVRAGRTVIVATHRLDAIRDADLIVTLDHGRIVERGTHDDLIGRDGLYAHLGRRARISAPSSPRSSGRSG